MSGGPRCLGGLGTDGNQGERVAKIGLAISERHRTGVHKAR